MPSIIIDSFNPGYGKNNFLAFPTYILVLYFVNSDMHKRLRTFTISLFFEILVEISIFIGNSVETFITELYLLQSIVILVVTL